VKVPAVFIAGLLAVLVEHPSIGADARTAAADQPTDPLTARVVSPSDQSIWAVATRASTSEIWHADSAGHWQAIAIPAFPRIDRFEDAAAATGNGDVYFAGWADGRLHLIKVAASGRVVFIRALGFRLAQLSGMTRASERSTLLFGRSDRGAFAAEIDDSGLRKWAIEIDEHPSAAAFTDANLNADGTGDLTASIRPRSDDPLDTSRPRTLLIAVDSTGRIVRSKSIGETNIALSTLVAANGVAQ
jgi:hypothetical protein